MEALNKDRFAMWEVVHYTEKKESPFVYQVKIKVSEEDYIHARIIFGL